MERQNEDPASRLIRNAGDFNDLFAALRQTKGLRGSHSLYTPDELITLIEEVRNGDRALNYVTRTSGLRTKVDLLMNAERAAERLTPLPHAGEHIHLAKLSVHTGESGVQVHGALKGVLNRDIRVGEPVVLSGGNTTAVRSIETRGGRRIIVTETSIYEILPSDDRLFQGLSMSTDSGYVNLPINTQDAVLDSSVVDERFGDTQFYINKPVLTDVLLEVNGIQIFRAVEGRFMVLAKVGKIHLPFYISSSGTDGKRAGEWYPFFGYTGDWLVKGSIKTNGDMEYHPEVSRVQNVLNQNLIINQNKLLQGGVAKTQDGRIVFDLKQHMKFLDYSMTKEWREDTDPEEKELEFVQRQTGYYPKKVRRAATSTYSWIDAVLEKI